jgi:hypothetical protein
LIINKIDLLKNLFFTRYNKKPTYVIVWQDGRTSFFERSPISLKKGETEKSVTVWSNALVVKI